MKEFFYGFVTFLLIAFILVINTTPKVYDAEWKVLPQYDGCVVISKTNNFIGRSISVISNNKRCLLWCEDIHLIEYVVGDTLVAEKWK